MHGVSWSEYKRRRHAIRHWEDALRSLATPGDSSDDVYPMPRRARKKFSRYGIDAARTLFLFKKETFLDLAKRRSQVHKVLESFGKVQLWQ